ncbi:LPXTG-motif cell wall anchor domain-containing protein, partial [Leuconostocaceae bacterium R-53105]
VLSTSVSNAKAQGHSALPNTGKDSNKQSAAGLIGLAAATLSLGVLGSKRKKEEEK